jgi:hypothetical protein
MTLASVADFRAHVSTTLADGAVQDKLDAAEQEIVRTIGPVGPVSEFYSRVSGPLLMLSRRAAEITTVTEGTTTLAATDYRLRSGTVVQRLSSGTPCRWRDRNGIEVAYLPESDVAERIRVQIALVQLDLTYVPGVVSEKIGDWAETFTPSGDHDKDREAILATLNANAAVMF